MIIPVGIGEARFSARASDVLVCYGLGSCVGVSFYDPVRRAGGLVHVMLPTPTGAAQAFQPGKFADLAIPHALKELIALGAVPARLQIKLVGGAQMLGLASDRRFDIGSRNCEAVRAALSAVKLTSVAEVTGGNTGRTMMFHIDDGRVLVSSFGSGETII